MRGHLPVCFTTSMRESCAGDYLRIIPILSLQWIGAIGARTEQRLYFGAVSGQKEIQRQGQPSDREHLPHAEQEGQRGPSILLGLPHFTAESNSRNLCGVIIAGAEYLESLSRLTMLKPYAQGVILETTKLGTFAQPALHAITQRATYYFQSGPLMDSKSYHSDSPSQSRLKNDLRQVVKVGRKKTK